ncbi:hypothetical protein FKM82_006362 [Ascaphus truei]
MSSQLGWVSERLVLCCCLFLFRILMGSWTSSAGLGVLRTWNRVDVGVDWLPRRPRLGLVSGWVVSPGVAGNPVRHRCG